MKATSSRTASRTPVKRPKQANQSRPPRVQPVPAMPSRIPRQNSRLASRPAPKDSGFGYGPTNRRSQTITEDEFITDINGSPHFKTTAFAFNPGNANSFPWASRPASNYEKYRVISAEYYYKRIVSEFATNGQTGKVIFSFDYDASDAPPASKQMAEDQFPHKDGMPCEEFSLRLDPKQLNSQDSKYVRPGAQPPNTDIKTYDGGNLFVSTVGCVDSSPIGELRIRYTIQLLNPVLNPGSSVIGGSITSSGTTSPTNPFGDDIINPQSVGISVSGLDTTISQPGTYVVTCKISGSTLTNLTFIPALNPDGSATNNLADPIFYPNRS